ncbi:MAG: hypothetical protein IJX18_01905 [Clostridia bacterium]|nr:hypothetical protein [Clostridia bacterium]
MQYLVSVGKGKEREEAFSWLEEHGYEVSSRLKDGSYPYSVVVIDYGVVFGGSVSIFAIKTSHGEKVMSWAQWKEEKLKNKLYC